LARLVRNSLDRQLAFFEDRKEAATAYLSALQGRVQGEFHLWLFLSVYDVEHSEFSYNQAARLMTESLNAPAAQKGIGAGVWAWQDRMFVGDRATTTDLTDDGRRAFDALPVGAVFYNPNGRVCLKDSPTHAKFFVQWWSEDKKSTFEVYRGPDGNYYRMSDNSLVK
jgi:hypothetical protein